MTRLSGHLVPAHERRTPVAEPLVGESQRPIRRPTVAIVGEDQAGLSFERRTARTRWSRSPPRGRSSVAMASARDVRTRSRACAQSARFGGSSSERANASAPQRTPNLAILATPWSALRPGESGRCFAGRASLSGCPRTKRAPPYLRIGVPFDESTYHSPANPCPRVSPGFLSPGGVFGSPWK